MLDHVGPLPEAEKRRRFPWSPIDNARRQDLFQGSGLFKEMQRFFSLSAITVPLCESW
jgi:hypothetical protein